MSSGIWDYNSAERQGTYRLVLVKRGDNCFTAQRQRFNPDGSSLPLSRTDTHQSTDLEKARDWLLECHKGLICRGFQLKALSGVFSRTVQLSVDAAKKRHRMTRRAARRPAPVSQLPIQAAAG